MTATQYVMCFRFCGWHHVFFLIIDRLGHGQIRRVCFVRFARWRHRGRSLLPPTASITALCIVFSERTTLCSLYAIGRPSVCRLSVTLVHPTQAVELFGNFFSPYDSSGSLLFWCQKSLVGDAPFPLKFAFKVTHPLSNSEISTNIGS